MNSALKKFIVYTVVAGFILVMGAWLLNSLIDNKLSITPVFFVVPFVMIVTILFHFYLLKASKGDAKVFVGKFVASSGIKLMLYLTVIVFYVVWYRQNEKVFLTSFLISYIVFTFIEVLFILSQTKK